MALVQLADIIDVTVFQDLPAEDSPEKTAFFESGVIVRVPLLDELANQAGKTAELPFWKDLDETSETNYSDDSETDAVPEKVVQGEQIARKAFVNKGWKESDLASELALGGTALTRVRKRTDSYFTKQFSRRVIASARGILADNVANDASDMVNDIASESVAGQSVSTKWSRTAFTSAVFTLGDAQGDIKAIGVHSGVYQQMVDADDVTFVPDSEGGEVPTYLGRRVIVDDSLPVIAGTTDGVKYVSVLFGEGMFGYGEGMAKVPVELDRDASQGNGGGTEELWVRKTWLLHPFGYQALGTPAVGTTFTLAELADGAKWDRVINRKNVPLAFLITN